jgi:hypothetical protein
LHLQNILLNSFESAWSQWFLVVFFENSNFGSADRVFGPATTTRHVYDVAAQHVVSGAMEGINGNYLTLYKLKF